MLGKFIQQPGGYQAFMPADFPAELGLELSKQTVLANDTATLALGKLDGISQLVPNIDFFTLMYGRKEAALSSNIEGTKATMHDYLKANAQITKDIPRDVEDIINYVKALNHGLQRLDDLPLASNLIKEIHNYLLPDTAQNKTKTPGSFRTSQNWIGGTQPSNADFVPPPPFELHKCLKDLDNFINTDNLYPPLIKIALTHAQFETIHPFLDGNGRIGRLVLTLQLCHDNLLERPVLYFSEYLKRHRDTYFSKLTDYRKGMINEWLQFFLGGIRETANDSINVSKQLIELHNRDHSLVHGLGRQAPSALKLLRGLYKQPVMGAAQVAAVTGLSRQASYNLIRNFLNLGILEKLNPETKYGNEFAHGAYIRLFNDSSI